MLAVVYSIAEDVHDASVLDLPFETVQKPLAGVVVSVELEGLGGLRLGLLQEVRELGQVDARCGIVVLAGAHKPAGFLKQSADPGLEPLFAGVGGHRNGLPSWVLIPSRRLPWPFFFPGTSPLSCVPRGPG